MRKSLFTPMIITAGALAVAASLAVGQSDSPTRNQTPQRLRQEDQATSRMYDEMMSHWRDYDSRLTELTRKMNDASGQDKVGAMADVLNELVNEQKSMREGPYGMWMMNRRMMSDMADHMAANMPEEHREAMSRWMGQCPWFQGDQENGMMMHGHGMMHGGAWQ